MSRKQFQRFQLDFFWKKEKRSFMGGNEIVAGL